MLKSMTGYAEATLQERDWTLRLAIRSLNHRFLDLHIRLPVELEFCEPVMRQGLRNKICRGHLDVSAQISRKDKASVQVNRDALTGYVSLVRELRREYSFDSSPNPAELLRLPGVLVSEHGPVDEETRRTISGAVERCLAEAIARLDEMRTQEGQALAKELGQRAQKIQEVAAKLEALNRKAQPQYFQLLQNRLQKLLVSVAPEPSRITQEAAILAERSDITEEVTRLRSHIGQFEQMISTGGEMGKKLDFLLQEMQREANTLMAKSPGVEADGIAITDLGLQLKAEIEKLREQVQNVE